MPGGAPGSSAPHGRAARSAPVGPGVSRGRCRLRTGRRRRAGISGNGVSGAGGRGRRGRAVGGEGGASVLPTASCFAVLVLSLISLFSPRPNFGAPLHVLQGEVGADGQPAAVGCAGLSWR